MIGGINIKYESINNLFNIMDVTDNYILLKDKNNIKKVYIYEIEPVTFLNFSIDVQSNILNLYNEFLRELNLNFQIYISNKKVNIQKYIQSLKESVISDNAIIKKYIESISKELENDTLYSTKYYIVISVSREEDIDIESIDVIIEKLKYIGCNVRKVQNKKTLKNILYESINKEVIA